MNHFLYTPNSSVTDILDQKRHYSMLNRHIWDQIYSIDTKDHGTSCVVYFLFYGPLFERLISTILNRPTRSIGMHMIPLKSRFWFRQSRLKSDSHVCVCTITWTLISSVLQAWPLYHKYLSIHPCLFLIQEMGLAFGFHNFDIVMRAVQVT